MPNLPISGLPTTATPLATDEIAQEQSLVTKKITLQQISDFANTNSTTTLQDAYDNGDGSITVEPEIPFLINQDVLGGLIVAQDSLNQEGLLVDSVLTLLSSQYDFLLSGKGRISTPPWGDPGTVPSYFKIGFEKPAMRFGIADNNEFDDVNVGDMSVAMGQNVIAAATNSYAFGNEITINLLAQNAMVFGAGANITSTANRSFTWSDDEFATFTVTDPNTFNVHSSNFVYFETPEVRTTADRLHFNKEAISASYIPCMTALAVAGGAIQVGAPLTASTTESFRLIQIPTTGNSPGIVAFAVTSAASSGDIIEICGFNIVTCQMDAAETASRGAPLQRDLNLSGRVASKPESIEIFGLAAQPAGTNDFLKVWVINNSLSGAALGVRRALDGYEYDDAGGQSAGRTRPYPGVTVYTFDAVSADRLGVISLILPSDFDATVDIEFEMIWAPETASVGDVVWNLDYAFLTPDGTNPLNGNQALISTTLAASTNAEMPDKHTFTLNTALALPGDELFVYLTRLGNDGADTYPNDIWVTSLVGYYMSA